MKALFVIDHPAIGWLAPVLRGLDERGHHVHLAFRRVKVGESLQDVERLVAESARMTVGELPPGVGSPRGRLARSLRSGIDYLRYLEPRYRDATKLRARARERAPSFVVRSGGIAPVVLRRALQLLERCLLPPAHVERFLREQAPDAVFVTPLVELGSRQADYLRAAKRLGLRTGFPVFSWDNLTNKGLLRDAPDLVLVWNDLQAAEAEELHRVPRERVRVTGAPAFDHWFGWKPSRSRDDFCAEVGLRADRPIVLYLCSSRFVAPDEFAFIRRWIDGLRAAGGLLAEAGILVRPHPLNKEWQRKGVELSGMQVRVWPPLGEAPHDERSYSNYYDSIYHSAAVVGINTTAQIESAIVGRPVHTLLADEFRETQLGTLHFHYLQAEGFGHLYVGRTFEEHAAQLEVSLRGRDDAARNERFLRRFVRPQGLDVPAAKLTVDAIEELAARPAPQPDRGPLLAPLARLALTPLAKRMRRREARDTPDAPSPLDELRRSVRKAAAGTDPVVAGPWLGDEIGELLYWIPFLRWAQTANLGLRERLVVVRRAESAPWYGDIGAEMLDPGDAAPAGKPLAPDVVAAARRELAHQDPALRIRRRLLDFAPLTAPELAPGLDLPEEFVAVSGRIPEVDAATVALDELDRAAVTAVLARARAFAGWYGAEAYVAVLLGVPAVALYDSLDTTMEDDLRLASAFLSRPPFGTLTAVPKDAERVSELLDAATGRASIGLRG